MISIIGALSNSDIPQEVHTNITVRIGCFLAVYRIVHYKVIVRENWPFVVLLTAMLRMQRAIETLHN